MKVEKGMVAVITGAGAGMGAELSTICAKLGANLALCDINEENLARSKKKCESFGCFVSTHIVDVSSREQVHRFAREVDEAHGGKVNLLINNAGVASTAPFHKETEENFDWCFNINVHGVINCTRAFLPMIRAQKTATIVNISSVAGYYAGEYTGSAYTTSKFAVRGFSEGLLVEARKFFPHVNVLTVHPGIIRTDIIDSSRGISLPSNLALTSGDTAKVKQMVNKFYSTFGYTAREAAVMIMEAVLAGKTRARVGWDAVIIDWWVRLFPRIMASPFDPLVGLTAIVLRKAYLPMAISVLAYYWLRSGKSKL